MPKKILKITSFAQPVYLNVFYDGDTDEKLGPFNRRNTPFEHDLSGRDILKIEINSKLMMPTVINPPALDPSIPKRTHLKDFETLTALTTVAGEQIPDDLDLIGKVSINVMATEMRED